ncbi:multidrug effflux MFS transporter [Methanosarcina sp. Z-7115]|uniref:Multidrug effflux MFS transporter n=1 Tax=Methanosarcina baikalica TaxID=3073890 RepID=A0ABU2CY40_9EURY|nr:multidrug effflux MFS transporter [Methanosarcina sp. Z-7115]MDR7664613.1 multidrug effflux MFS transporter [Methanosarcina sp. Z-7115]
MVFQQKRNDNINNSNENSKRNLKGAVPLLALLTAFPALSTDMILPAIPSLAKTWNQPLSVMNLTLVCFFVTYGFFLLFYGPVSDRFGRRRPLLFGLAVYIVASLLCAFASSASMLIGLRILQAAGAAASSSISMAMTKDIFSGQERERILAYIAVIMALAPMLGPVLGGWVLANFSWPWIFFIQAVMGLIGMIRVLHFPETLPQVSDTPLSRVMHTYGRLLLNPSYIVMVLVMSTSLFPLYSFIAGSSDIYINGFGMTEQKYSYFFAFNAMALMVGSFACLRLTGSISSRHLITVGFVGIFLGGIFLLLTGQHGPWSFALPMFLITFSLGLSRPPSNNLVLEQVDRDTGSASSLLIFSYFTLGAVGMWFISLEWADKIPVLGAIALGCGALVLGAWVVLQRKGIGGVA